MTNGYYNYYNYDGSKSHANNRRIYSINLIKSFPYEKMEDIK